MRLPGAIALVALAALAAAFADSATAHSPNGTATYVRVRPDPRMCPSPMCGGWWVRRVNRDTIVCGNGMVSPECYAATVDSTELDPTDEQRAMIEHALARGTALLRARLVHGALAGAPPSVKLDVLSVTEIWLRYGRAQTSGTVFRIEDNGVRCVRAPCFSLHASVLNTTQHRDVSSLGLAAAGASAAAVRRARAALEATGVIVEGRVVATGDGGRPLRASAFWLRAV
jgi:Domain of unknown function (DUF6748)